MQKKSRPFNKYLIITAATLVVIISFIISLALHVIFTPERITPIITEAANQEFLSAKLSTSGIGISFFSTFPRFGIEIENGSIVKPIESKERTPKKYPPADTLISFDKCIISFNLMALLMDDRIDIQSVHFEKARLNLVSAPNGQTNWDIMKASTDTVVATEPDTSQYEINLNVADIHLSDARFYYQDQATDTYFNLDHIDNQIAATVNDTIILFETSFQGILVDFWQQRKLLARRDTISANTLITLNKKTRKIDLGTTTAKINQLECVISGSATPTEERKLAIDLDVHFGVPTLASLVELAPRDLIRHKRRIKASGSVDSWAKINGFFGKGELPEVNAGITIKNGNLKIAHKDHTIELISLLEADMTGFYDPNHRKKSTLQVSRLQVKGTDQGLDISATGDAKDLDGNAEIHAKINALANLGDFIEHSPFRDSIDMAGSLTADVEGSFFLNDILNADYGKIDAKGTLFFHELSVNYQDSLAIEVPYLKVFLGHQQDSKMMTSSGSKVLAAIVNGGHINATIKDRLKMQTDTLFAGIVGTPPEDSLHITHLKTKIILKNGRFHLGDTLKARTGHIEGNLVWGPSPEDPTSPTLHSNLHIDSVMARTKDHAIGIRKGQYDFHLTRTADDEWPATGFIEFERAFLFSSYFPEPVKIPNTKITITPEYIALEKAHLLVGHSDVELTGKVYDVEKTFRHSQPLRAEMELTASLIDANELMHILKKAEKMRHIDPAEEMTVSLETTSPDTTSSEMMTFIVPKGIDFMFKSKIDEVRFGNLDIKNVQGKIRIKDQNIHLDQLELKTQAANMTASVRYWNQDSTTAKIDFDFNISDIDMSNLVGLFPAVDTLLPMATSFEGLLTFGLKGGVALDEKMGMALPTMRAISRLKGENLVLMDSETFGQMAKVLMFKNKKRNLVDSASFEMIIQDNALEILPSKVSMDRYTVALGGTTTMDMNYDFQVSVLESPMPFKAGIDITGNTDDYDIQVTKAKYKYLFSEKERHQKKVDSTIVKKKLAVLQGFSF